MILVSGCQHLEVPVKDGPTVWLPARLPYLHPDTNPNLEEDVNE